MRHASANDPRLTGTVCSFEQVRGSGEQEIRRLKRLQHGCVHREQMLAAGIGRGAISHRLKTQRIHALHCGVYLLSEDPPGFPARAMAAVLRLRGDGMLSHLAAGFVWGMVEGEPALIDVTLVGRQAHPVQGVRIHRVAALDGRELRWRMDLPLTAPARTVVDLAGVLDVLELENVLAVCREQRLCTVTEIRRAMNRVPASTRGVATLRRLLDQGGFARTKSYYERKLLGLLSQAGLPRPLTNHRLIGHEVDMAWLDRKLVVEFDSRKFHTDRRAFEHDRRRDQDLVAAGYRVIRVTARQLEQEPFGVIARIAAALAA